MRKRIEAAALVLLAVAVLAATHLYVVFYMPASRDGELKTVFIPRGTSFRVVAANLETAGVIKDSGSFTFAANMLGAYKKIKAGEYEFSASMSPMEVLEMLVKGKVVNHQVTVPEGYNISEIAQVLEKTGLANGSEFIKKARDKTFARELGIEGDTLEGYLFPDTYLFTKGMQEEEIARKMVEKFKAVYKTEFEEVARKKGMTLKKLVTLASIIEKETGVGVERDLISAVFHNRLKNRIRLQSDPTVIYGITGFDGNLTKRHLLADNPYNTYRNFGLPPGPIANPGKASLAAALNPAEADYLYFVSKNDGTHHFSSSLKEHNRAVNQFQRRSKSANNG